MPILLVNTHSLRDLAHGLIVAALLISALYAGGIILEPLAIAALLSFILAPVMRRMRIWGVPKTVSAIFAVALTLAAFSALGTTLVVQLSQLAEDLPKYENNLRAKIHSFSGVPLASGALERATGTLRELQNELSRADSVTGQSPATAAPGPKPVPVEVRQPDARGLEAVANLVRPLLSPLATSAFVILFLLFILLQREDIRDRFLRLAGTADLQRTTAALDDAAGRLGRFFLMQTLLNAGFGVVIAVGLAVIGVPNAVLWGILAALLRFVPFIGSFIAAVFPTAVAAAVDPGWSMALMTAALFIVTEPIAGQVIEPLVYGQHTGLSPVAIVISTLFWTLLWGPIGLLLATPLTVCLVVLGKHIQALNFIEVLLGDEPALLPEERFYQRLLAGDATEAADQAEEQLKTQSLSAYYDAIPMKALLLAQTDAAQGKLSPDKQAEMRATMEEIIDDLSDHPDTPPAGDGNESGPELTAAELLPEEAPASTGPVLCIASRSALDEAASAMLAQVLGKHAIAGSVQAFTPVGSAGHFKVNAPDARIVCLSYFGAAAKPAHVRYLIRRLRRVMPHTRFLACFWMLGGDPGKLEDWRSAVGADFVATSLSEATLICIREVLEKPVAPSPPKLVAA